MRMKAIRTFCLVSSLACLLPALSACGVAKDKYLYEFHARQDCQSSLDQCQDANRGLEGSLQDLEQRLKGQTEANAALLEELATLQAERDENLRKVSRYRQQLREREHQIAQMPDAYRSVIESLTQEIHEGNIRVDQSEMRLKLNLVDQILFASGSTNLTDKGKKILDKVGFALKDINDRRIMIEGHTDDVPLSPALEKLYGSNWELSAMRAAAVVRHLQEHGGIDPRLLAATGYSMYRPYRDNDTAEGRQANRRIEIILTPLSLQEMQELHASPAQAVPAPGATSSLPAGR